MVLSAKQRRLEDLKRQRKEGTISDREFARLRKEQSLDPGQYGPTKRPSVAAQVAGKQIETQKAAQKAAQEKRDTQIRAAEAAISKKLQQRQQAKIDRQEKEMREARTIQGPPTLRESEKVYKYRGYTQDYDTISNREVSGGDNDLSPNLEIMGSDLSKSVKDDGSPISEAVSGAVQLGFDVGEFVVSSARGAVKILPSKPEATIEFGQSKIINRILNRDPDLNIGIEKIRSDRDVQNALVFGTFATLPGGEKIAAASFLGMEGYRVVKEPSAKNIGRLTAASLITAAPKILPKIKETFSSTKLELEGVQGPTGKVTFVGEGTIKGTPAEVVITSGPKGSKTFVRTEGGLKTITSSESILPKPEITTSVTRDIKPVFEGEGLEVQRSIATETALSRVAAEGAFTKLNLRTGEIVKTRIDVTPRVKVVEAITGEGRVIKEVSVDPVGVEFGTTKAPKDLLDISHTPKETIITKVKAPRVSQTGTRTQSGFGKLTIEEPSLFSQKASQLARSKRAAVTRDPLLKTEPEIKITPSKFSEIYLPEVPKSILDVKPEVSLKTLPLISQRPEVAQKPIAKVRPSARQAIIPKQKSFVDGLIKTSSAVKPQLRLDTAQNPRTTPSYFPRQAIMPKQSAPTSPISPVPIRPIFEEPKQFTRATPFKFRLPELQFPEDKPRRRGKPSRRKLGITPSFTGRLLELKPKKTAGLFPSLEVR